MKNKLAKYSLLVALLCFSLYSCDDEVTEYQTGTLELADGYITIGTPAIAFIAGTASYDASINVVPAKSGATSIGVYKTFNDPDGNTTNEALLKTIDIDETQLSESVTFSFGYDELTAGLAFTESGAALPTNQAELRVGSNWNLRVVGVDESGNEVNLGPENILVGVLSIYAGLYEVTESAYYRINVESSLTNWVGTRILIGSVNETTFSHINWWGPFEYAGTWNFVVNDDNTIKVPKVGEIEGITQQLFSGNSILNCEEDGGTLVNVPCIGSNILVPDATNPDVANAAHSISLTFGYFTENSDPAVEGPREFYEKLVKVVE